MARKAKGSDNFDQQKLIDRLQAATGGDLPELAGCEAEEWHELDVNLGTIIERDDLGPKQSWSGFSLTARWKGEHINHFEIPFWAMKAFVEHIATGLDVDENMWAEMEYKRTFDSNGKNQALFK